MSDIALGGFRKLARHTFVYATADLIAKGGAFLLVPIITRWLSQKDVGTYSLVVSTLVPVITLISSVGLGGAVTRLWFDLDKDSRKRFQLAAFASVQAVALALALLLTLWGPFIFRSLFPGVRGSLFAFGVWTSFFLASTTVPLAILRAEEKPKRFAILSAAQFLGPAIGVLIAIAMRGGIHTVLWGNVIGASAVMALSIAFMIPLVAKPAGWSMMRPALALGIPVVPHLVAHWALNVSDRVAISRSLGVAAVALYSVGYQIAQGVSLIATALNNATVPTFYRAAKQGRRDVIGRAWAPVLFGIGLFSVAVSIFGPEVIHIAKHSYQRSATFIPWVALGYWFLAAYYFPVNALFYAKRVLMIPVATIVAAALNYVLNVVMLPHRGLIAAAQNTAIAYGVLFALVMIAAQRTYKLPYRFGKAFFLAITGIGAYLLSTLVPHGPLGVILKLPIFASYVVIGFLLVDSDVRMLRGSSRTDGTPTKKVVFAAATASQARTMMLAGRALQSEGIDIQYVSLDPILGKSASQGFRDLGVMFEEHGTHAGQMNIVLRGRSQARLLVEGAAAVVIGNDFTPFERLVIEAARAAGCVSVLLQDGVISLEGDQAGGGARSGRGLINIAKRFLALIGFPFGQLPYGNGGCDLVCVYGPSTKQALIGRGVPASRIVVTGQPRYDALELRNMVQDIVLVTTQPFSRYGLASLDHETETFAAMIEAALANTAHVVVKLHPDTSMESKNALTSRFPTVRFERSIPIEDLYQRCLALVTLSSTTALEAMINQVPVVVVDIPGFPATLPYIESGAVFVAASKEEIGEVLATALAHPNARQSAAAAFLGEHLAPLDGAAAARVARAIREAIDEHQTMKNL